MPIANPIVIDVHVDYVCPWCYIGTTRLDRAVAASGLADRVVIKRHPFLLDADIPPEGVDLAARLQKKYGRDPKQMFAQVEGVARQSGVPLDFAKQTRTYSTIAAHALMGYLIEIDASEKTQRAVEADLFTLHFVEGGNLSDTEALVRVAARHGVPEAPTRAALADKGRFDTVRRLAGEARGIGGVPYFKFENGETISGAQSEEVLAAAIKRAAAVTR